MKPINLKSLIDIYEHNKLTYCSKNGYFNFCGNELKIVDIETLKKFISEITSYNVQIAFFNDFYFGYSIPQIGKEFDLLRFTDNSVLNIELKSAYTPKVEKQLIKNKYYLKFLDKQMYLYTYVAQDNTLWKLNYNDKLIKCDFQEIVSIIEKHINESLVKEDPDKIFIPSNYLISPFNKTQEFINGEYFLTQEQEEIEKKVYQSILDGKKSFLITGNAGSGKTLLTYHLAKKFINEGKNVGIIHAANLNSGHVCLRSKFQWNIEPIKNWNLIFSKSKPYLIVIDEAQRLNHKEQFANLMQKINNVNAIVIFSGDRNQILGKNEGWSLNSNCEEHFELTGKIRTNKELANFIKVLLNLKRKHHMKVSSQNINITFFNDVKDATQYICSKQNEYKYISYTPNNARYSPPCEIHKYNFIWAETSHQVIGQEFENVIVIMGRHFYYDKDNLLRAYNVQHNPYFTLRMFFQQITRAINKLEIVIVENIELYNNIMQIFE